MAETCYPVKVSQWHARLLMGGRRPPGRRHPGGHGPPSRRERAYSARWSAEPCYMIRAALGDTGRCGPETLPEFRWDPPGLLAARSLSASGPSSRVASERVRRR